MQSRAWAITWRKWLLLAAFATTMGVCSLPAQTPDDAEIARAARQFRRQVYLNYRTERGEFDRRRAAAAQAEGAYRDAGGTADDAERLRSWLLAAASASAHGKALPTTPSFGPDAKMAENLPEPALETKTHSSVPFGPSMDSTPTFSADTKSVIIVESPPDPLAAESTESTELVPAESGDEPNTESAAVTAEEPEATPVDATPVAEAETLDEEPQATAPPMDAEPADVEFPLVERQPQVVPEIAAPDPQPTEPAMETSESSGVNVKELAARVSGHNFAVRAILLDWSRGGNGDLAQLATAVEQAASLGRRYGLLETYLHLLSQSERDQTGDLEELDEVFKTLGDAIADLRERYEQSALPAEERTAEVGRLNSLSRQLAEAYAAYDAETEQQP